MITEENKKDMKSFAVKKSKSTNENLMTLMTDVKNLLNLLVHIELKKNNWKKDTFSDILQKEKEEMEKNEFLAMFQDNDNTNTNMYKKYIDKYGNFSHILNIEVDNRRKTSMFQTSKNWRYTS